MPKRITISAAKRKKVAEYIASGVSQKSAFSLCGINAYTGAKWVREGKDDLAAGRTTTEPAKFVQAIEDARAALEHTVIQRIKIIDVEVDAFTFLKYLRDQEAKREARESENAGGMGGYTPPQVGE